MRSVLGRTKLVLLAAILAGCAGSGGPPSSHQVPTPSSHPVRTNPLRNAPMRDISDCRSDPLGEVGTVDVVIVIDSSGSTIGPSGFDINQNGEVGISDVGGATIALVLGGFTESTDVGDSFHAAQILAAKSLVWHLADADVRFSIVSLSGNEPPLSPHRGRSVWVAETFAIVVSELTNDIEAVDRILDQVVTEGAKGKIRFSTGMEVAIQTLAAPSNPERAARKRVLFMSDSPNSTFPGEDRGVVQADPAMKDAARAAIEAGVVFDSFGLGKAAEAKPPHPLSMIAAGTGGAYRPVPDAAELHCELVQSFVQ